MKNCVIYARYSSDRQTEQSIEGQLRVCYEFAARNDLNIVHEYIDRAMTGTNDNRKDFQQMLSDSEHTKEWEICLVYALDRFGRNSIEQAINKYKLQKQVKSLYRRRKKRREISTARKTLTVLFLKICTSAWLNTTRQSYLKR